MTGEEFKKHFVSAVAPCAAWAAGHYHLSADQMGILTSDIGYVATGAAFVYGAYLRWNTKAVPTTAVVTGQTAEPNTSGLVKDALPVVPRSALPAFALSAVLAFVLAFPVHAADLKPALLKAPAIYDPAGSGGWYVGAGTELVSSKEQVADTKILSQSGALGIIGGYGRGNGVSWWQVQGEMYWRNLDGNGVCGLSGPCSVSSNFSAGVWLKVGGPITSTLLNTLPQVASLFPGLAPTTIANNVFPYLAIGATPTDVSGTLGLANAKAWLIPFGARAGAITKLTNGTVSDAGVEVDFAGSGFSLGGATVKPDVTYKAYLHFAFGA